MVSLEYLYAQGFAISTGRAGPACHCMLPVSRNSLVLWSSAIGPLPLVFFEVPPIMKTPTWLRVTATPFSLAIVRLPIMARFQTRLTWSNTRQVALVPTPCSTPPQMAMEGLGPEVKKVVWRRLLNGKSGTEQFSVLGYTSTDLTLVLSVTLHPPVIKAKVSPV